MDPREVLISATGARAIWRLDSARLVLPAHEHSIHRVAARLARSSGISLDHASGPGALLVRGDADKLAQIDQHRDTRAIRAVYVDGGHELALTDEVLVEFTPGTSHERRAQICAELDSHPTPGARDPDQSRWTIHVDDPSPDAPLRVATTLSDLPEVVNAEPNALQRARPAGSEFSEDTRESKQWHLDAIDIRAAWDHHQGAPSVKVVLIDQGFDINHPDLRGQFLPGWNFDDGNLDVSTRRSNHGTACAGLIAARRDGRGVVGVAPGIKIVPLRADQFHTTASWAKLFERAAQMGDLICFPFSLTWTWAVTEALDEALARGRNGAGVAMFAATGNEGAAVSFPARHDKVIGVGAATDRDEPPRYSNFGAGLELLAPSSGGRRRIETTDLRRPLGSNRNGDYCEADTQTGFGGTSAATAIAAGVGALMLSVNPILRATELQRLLTTTARDIGQDKDARGWSPRAGWGRIDAGAAVAAVPR